MVLTLTLDGSLDGADLAAALGTSTSTAHVVAHRMRERLATSVGALLVARGGRKDCRDLNDLLGDWDGQFNVITRKRVARHIERCDVCSDRRRKAPVALLSAGPVLAAPIALRDRVLGDVQLVAHTAKPWSSDGFPPRDRAVASPVRRRGVLAGAAAVLVALAIAGSLLWPSPTDTVIASPEPSQAPTTTRASTTSSASTQPATTTIAAAPLPPPPGEPPVPPAADSTAAPTTTTPGVTPTGPPTAGVPGSTAATTTTIALRVPTLGIAPLALDFATTKTTDVVRFTNTGDQAATVTLTTPTPWISLSTNAISISPGANASVTVTVNRQQAAEGALTGSINTAVAGGATTPIAVSMTVAAPPTIRIATTPAQFSTAGPCTVTAVIGDPSGIASASVEYSTAAGTGRAAMTGANGGTWTAAVSVGGPPRTITWRVVATDALGNRGQSADRTTPAASFCS